MTDQVFFTYNGHDTYGSLLGLTASGDARVLIAPVEQVRAAGELPAVAVVPLVAAYTSLERSINAKKQLRDKKGRWIFMGKGIFKFLHMGNMVAGPVVNVDVAKNKVTVDVDGVGKIDVNPKSGEFVKTKATLKPKSAIDVKKFGGGAGQAEQDIVDSFDIDNYSSKKSVTKAKQSDYEVGDVIEETFGDQPRKILVVGKAETIKPKYDSPDDDEPYNKGESGFDGVVIDKSGNLTSEMVWGYDADITGVQKKQAETKAKLPEAEAPKKLSDAPKVVRDKFTAAAVDFVYAANDSKTDQSAFKSLGGLVNAVAKTSHTDAFQRNVGDLVDVLDSGEIDTNKLDAEDIDALDALDDAARELDAFFNGEEVPQKAELPAAPEPAKPTSQQANAFEFYTASGYEPINDALRAAQGGMPADDSLAGMVKTLDELIDGSEITPAKTLYRGIRVKNKDMPADGSQTWVDALSVGDQLSDFGFTSASENITTAEHFAGYLNGEKITGAGAVLVIDVPEGTKGLNVVDFAAKIGLEDPDLEKEKETLLPRGMTLRIDSVDDKGDGVRYLHASIVTEEKASDGDTGDAGTAGDGDEADAKAELPGEDGLGGSEPGSGDAGEEAGAGAAEEVETAPVQLPDVSDPQSPASDKLFDEDGDFKPVNAPEAEGPQLIDFGDPEWQQKWQALADELGVTPQKLYADTQKYTTPGWYRDMNQYLRLGTTQQHSSVVISELNKNVAAVINAHTPSKTETVYRGVHFDAKGNGSVVTDAIEKALQDGTPLQDLAFVSTTTSKKWGEHYANRQKKGGFLLELTLEPGDRALDMQGLRGKHGQVGYQEHEFVLPPGAQIQLNSLEDHPSIAGVKVIKASIVKDTESGGTANAGTDTDTAGQPGGPGVPGGTDVVGQPGPAGGPEAGESAGDTAGEQPQPVQLGGPSDADLKAYQSVLSQALTPGERKYYNKVRGQLAKLTPKIQAYDWDETTGVMGKVQSSLTNDTPEVRKKNRERYAKLTKDIAPLDAKVRETLAEHLATDAPAPNMKQYKHGDGYSGPGAKISAGIGAQGVEFVGKKYGKDDALASHLNAALRYDGHTVAVDEYVETVANGMHYAINKSKLKGDSVLYRAAMMTPESVGRLEVGDTYLDHGFVSSTKVPHVAEQYLAKRKKYAAGKVPVMIKIEAPAGTHAIDITAHKGFDREVVLANDTEFEIKSISWNAAENRVDIVQTVKSQTGAKPRLIADKPNLDYTTLKPAELVALQRNAETELENALSAAGDDLTADAVKKAQLKLDAINAELALNQTKKKFEILDDPGSSGDGFYPDTHFWGKFGASGVLMRAKGKDGKDRFLFMQRNESSSSLSLKWQLPGGALNEAENDYQGAARETSEELSIPDKDIAKLKPVDESRFEHESGWHYTTITADAPKEFDVSKIDPHEANDAKWLTAEEIQELKDSGELHPVLADQIDKLLELFTSPVAAPDAAIDTTEAEELSAPLDETEAPTLAPEADEDEGGPSFESAETELVSALNDAHIFTKLAEAQVVDDLPSDVSKLIESIAVSLNALTQSTELGEPNGFEAKHLKELLTTLQEETGDLDSAVGEDDASVVQSLADVVDDIGGLFDVYIDSANSAKAAPSASQPVGNWEDELIPPPSDKAPDIPPVADGVIGMFEGKQYVSDGNGNAMFEGDTVKSKKDGVVGVIKKIEGNGKYVKVQTPDGAIKGRRTSTLEVQAAQVNAPEVPEAPKNLAPKPAPAPKTESHPVPTDADIASAEVGTVISINETSGVQWTYTKQDDSDTPWESNSGNLWSNESMTSIIKNQADDGSDVSSNKQIPTKPADEDTSKPLPDPTALPVGSKITLDLDGPDEGTFTKVDDDTWILDNKTEFKYNDNYVQNSITIADGDGLTVNAVEGNGKTDVDTDTPAGAVSLDDLNSAETGTVLSFVTDNGTHAKYIKQSNGLWKHDNNGVSLEQYSSETMYKGGIQNNDTWQDLKLTPPEPGAEKTWAAGDDTGLKDKEGETVLVGDTVASAFGNYTVTGKKHSDVINETVFSAINNKTGKEVEVMPEAIVKVKPKPSDGDDTGLKDKSGESILVGDKLDTALGVYMVTGVTFNSLFGTNVALAVGENGDVKHFDTSQITKYTEASDAVVDISTPVLEAKPVGTTLTFTNDATGKYSFTKNEQGNWVGVKSHPTNGLIFTNEVMNAVLVGGGPSTSTSWKNIAFVGATHTKAIDIFDEDGQVFPPKGVSTQLKDENGEIVYVGDQVYYTVSGDPVEIVGWNEEGDLLVKDVIYGSTGSIVKAIDPEFVLADADTGAGAFASPATYTLNPAAGTDTWVTSANGYILKVGDDVSWSDDTGSYSGKVLGSIGPENTVMVDHGPGTKLIKKGESLTLVEKTEAAPAAPATPAVPAASPVAPPKLAPGVVGQDTQGKKYVSHPFSGKPIYVGTTVKHPQHGEGVVKTLESNGKYVKVTFTDANGTKHVKGLAISKLDVIGGETAPTVPSAPATPTVPAAPAAPAIPAPKVYAGKDLSGTELSVGDVVYRKAYSSGKSIKILATPYLISGPADASWGPAYVKLTTPWGSETHLPLAQVVKGFPNQDAPAMPPGSIGKDADNEPYVSTHFGTPVFIGNQVKNTSDNKTVYTVKSIQKSGTYVTVYYTDENGLTKTKGMAVSKIYPVSGTQKLADGSFKTGGSASAVQPSAATPQVSGKTFVGTLSLPPHSGNATFAGAEAHKYNEEGASLPGVQQPDVTGGLDKKNPLYGAPEPVMPEQLQESKVPYVSDEWLAKAKQRYLDNPTSSKASLEESFNWKKFQKVIDEGNTWALKQLFEAKYLDDEMYAEAKESIKSVKEAKQKLDEKNASLKAVYLAQHSEWVKANKPASGVNPNGFADMPELSTKSVDPDAPDWSQAHVGTASLESVLEKLKTSQDFAGRGISIAVDSSALEGVEVYVRHVRKSDGTLALELSSRLTPSHGDALTKAIVDNGIPATKSTLVYYNTEVGNDGIVKYASTAKNSDSGLTYSIDVSDELNGDLEGTVTFERAHLGKTKMNQHVRHNNFTMTLSPDATSEDIGRVFERFGIEARPATDGDLKVLAENKMLAVMASETNPLVNAKGSAREQKLAQIKQTYGVTPDQVHVGYTSQGHLGFYLPNETRDKVIEAAGGSSLIGFTHAINGAADVIANIVSGKRPGLLSTNQRWISGIGAGGQSSPSDVAGGSADFLYTKPLHTSTPSYSSRRLVVHPKAMLRRLDLYGNEQDNFGKHKSGTDVYKLVSQTYTYEIMAKHGIPIEDIWYIQAYTESERQEAIKKAKERGTYTVNGIPIEDFIITQGGKIPDIDETRWDIDPGAPNVAPAAP